MVTNPRLRWGLVIHFGVGDIALLDRRFRVDTLRRVEGLTALVHNPRKQSGLNGQPARVDHHTGMHRFALRFTIRRDCCGGWEKEGDEPSCEWQLYSCFDRPTW